MLDGDNRTVAPYIFWTQYKSLLRAQLRPCCDFYNRNIAAQLPSWKLLAVTCSFACCLAAARGAATCCCERCGCCIQHLAWG